MKTSQTYDKKKNIVHLSAILCCLLCLTTQSCVKDILPDNTTTNFEITLNIQTNLEVLTKATAEQELRIERGFVLVYDKDKIFKSIYPIDTSNIVDNGSPNPKITVEGLVSNNNQVVLILNPPKDISLTPPPTVEYTAIDATFELGDTGFETGTNGYPMSGEYAYKPKATITITRAVAKIDVYINSTLSGSHKENFTIENVKYDIFQQVTKGHITKPTTGLNYVPTDNGIPTTTIGTNHDFNKPLNSNGGNYIYEYPYSTNAIGGTTLTNTDYDKNRLAIILKVNRSTAPEYYRLDLYDQTTNKFLDIERNKHYKIIITNINRAGYNTATEALERQSCNTSINYEIIIGDDKTLSNGIVELHLKNYYDEILIRDSSYRKIEIAQVKYSAYNDMPTDPTKYEIKYGPLPEGVTATPNTLTTEFQPIMLTFTEDASFETSNITYTITVGDYIYNGNLAISRKSAIDCYAATFNLGGSILKFSNNTPIDWQKSINEGYISCDQTDPEAIPIFQDKIINESQITSSGMRIKYILEIKAPRYIGRDSSATNNHMIMEAIEENRNLSLNKAIAYCNLKNDSNGNGITDEDDTPLWRVPKLTQLNGINSNYNSISTLVSGFYWLDNSPGREKFAICSSSNTSIGDAYLAPDDDPYLIKVRCIRDL